MSALDTPLPQENTLYLIDTSTATHRLPGSLKGPHSIHTNRTLAVSVSVRVVKMYHTQTRIHRTGIRSSVTPNDVLPHKLVMIISVERMLTGRPKNGRLDRGMRRLPYPRLMT
jgi:hypothetical protein